MRALLIFLIAFLCFNHLQAQTYNGPKEDIQQILQGAKNFSSYVMDSDYENIANSYTVDAKIFPNGLKILKGKKDIRSYWTLPEGVKTSYHKIYPEEITVLENTAYDYGYYEGKTKRPDGTESSWKGKYVIVWKKIDNEWKMYLDIWNGIRKK